MKKILLWFALAMLLLHLPQAAQTKRNDIQHHPESAYKKAWCTQNKGIQEYINFDKTRVDCLTSNHAVELDFAPKWAQSVGQALHYQHATGKKAKVVLIIENPQKDLIYLTRVQSLAKTYNFEVECVFPDILSK